MTFTCGGIKTEGNTLLSPVESPQAIAESWKEPPLVDSRENQEINCDDFLPKAYIPDKNYQEVIKLSVV